MFAVCPACVRVVHFAPRLISWNRTFTSCLKFLGKASRRFDIAVSAIRPHPSGTRCHLESVSRLLFIQNIPENPPDLCKVSPSFPVIHLVDLSSGGERGERECVRVCARISIERKLLSFPMLRVKYLSSYMKVWMYVRSK